MAALLHDVRHACRSCRRAPGFTLAVAATLTLGIGANTALFTVIRAVLFDSLPYRDAARIVMIWDAHGDVRDDTWLSAREIAEYQRTARSYQHVSAFRPRDATLTGGNEPERVRAALVTPNTFDTLGIEPLLGRTFARDGASADDADAVVIGEGLWRRRFGGDVGAIGRRLRVDGEPRTIVGIMPRAFRLPLDDRDARATEMWTPLVLDPANLGGWGNRSLYGVGRLRATATAESATAELALLWRQWVAAGHVQNDREDPRDRVAIPVRDLVLGGLRPVLALQTAAVVVVLLIACVNASSLLLARIVSRQTELATRIALGAGRSRLLRLLLAEGLVLSLAGGIAGVAAALALVRMLAWLRPATLPHVETVRLDLPVLSFTFGLCVLCGVIVSLPAALAAFGRDTAGLLRTTRATAAFSTLQARRMLVIAEIGLAVVLLVAAGLLARSLSVLRAVDLGYRTDRVLTFGLALPAADYSDADSVVRFYERALDEIRLLPGVEHAAVVRKLPLSGTIGDWSITIEGRTPIPGDNPNGDWQVVTPEYFETLGIPALHGRLLDARDRADAPAAAVINDTMAAKYWGGTGALGRRFHLGTRDQPWITVVGIVPTVRHNALLEPPRAEMFLAHAQFTRSGGSTTRAMTVVVRTAGDPLQVAAPVRGAIRALDARLAMADLRTFDDVVTAATAPARFATLLVSLFAVVAAGLAVVGVAGLVAFDVTRRQREIGVRLALGGAPGQIVGRITMQAVALAGGGIAAGMLASLATAPLLRSQLVGVAPGDPETLAAVAVGTAAVVTLATWTSARRAARIDPLAALRAE